MAQKKQDQIYVFKYEDKFFYLTADTVCTVEQFTKIFLPNNHQNQTISFNYGSSENNVSHELNVSITPIVFQSYMTPFNVESDLELKEKLKEKLKKDLDTIWVKHQLSTEIKKDRKSILGKSNSVKYQDFEITNISYVQLKSNSPATKLSTKEYFKILGKFPKFPKSDPKTYTIISFENNNQDIIQSEDAYKYVQNNDIENQYLSKYFVYHNINPHVLSNTNLQNHKTIYLNALDNGYTQLMYVLQFNNGKYYYFTDNIQFTIKSICDSYLKSLNLNSNDYTDEIGIQQIRSNYDNGKIQYIKTSEKFSMEKTNYFFYNLDNLNNQTSIKNTSDIPLLNELPMSNNNLKLTHTKITFFRKIYLNVLCKTIDTSNTSKTIIDTINNNLSKNIFKFDVISDEICIIPGDTNIPISNSKNKWYIDMKILNNDKIGIVKPDNGRYIYSPLNTDKIGLGRKLIDNIYIYFMFDPSDLNSILIINKINSSDPQPIITYDELYYYLTFPKFKNGDLIIKIEKKIAESLKKLSNSSNTEGGFYVSDNKLYYNNNKLCEKLDNKTFEINLKKKDYLLEKAVYLEDIGYNYYYYYDLINEAPPSSAIHVDIDGIKYNNSTLVKFYNCTYININTISITNIKNEKDDIYTVKILIDNTLNGINNHLIPPVKNMYIFKFKDLQEYYYLTEDTPCTKEDIFKFYKKKMEEAKKTTVENLKYMQFNRLSNSNQIDTSYYSSIFYEENFLHFFRTYYAVADYNEENKGKKMTDLYDKTHRVNIKAIKDDTKQTGDEYYLNNLQAPGFIAKLEKKYPNYESPKNIFSSDGLWGTVENSELGTRTTYVTLINKNMARMEKNRYNQIITSKKYATTDEKIISSKNMFDIIGEIPNLVKSPTDYTEITFLSEEILPTNQIVPYINNYEDFSIKDGKLYCKHRPICENCTNNTFTIYLNEDLTGVYLEENQRGDSNTKRIYFPQGYHNSTDKKQNCIEYKIILQPLGLFFYDMAQGKKMNTFFLRWKETTDVIAVKNNNISFFNINGKKDSKDSSNKDHTIKIVINDVIANKFIDNTK